MCIGERVKARDGHGQVYCASSQAVRLPRP